MIRYSVYLETADDGRSMAHVLALPGCFVRAPTREQALDRVPEAISETLAWLRSHGELAPPVDDPVEIEIAEEITGLGPFDRGDAAALFSPERKPVTPEEMERHFRLMAHARADLLALVRDLPDDMLDWQPAPESLSIRHLLRHVGNAEEWYVSRLVDPETLPPEWERDGDLPVAGRFHSPGARRAHPTSGYVSTWTTTAATLGTWFAVGASAQVRSERFSAWA